MDMDAVDTDLGTGGAEVAEGFGVDHRQVVYEVIDGEALLIHLDTGTYYSLGGSGPEIWLLLVSGMTLAEARAAMERRHPAQAEAAGAEVERLAEQLLAEGLLRRVPATAAGEAPWPLGGTGAFEPAVLTRYSDMEYFLRLDPVHEADGLAGWPAPVAPVVDSGGGAR
jgi:hypothetical protein